MAFAWLSDFCLSLWISQLQSLTVKHFEQKFKLRLGDLFVLDSFVT